MKQILQNLGSGETLLAEVPCPRRGSGAVLVETTRSLVSLGTEKMLIDFSRGGWLAKARAQPDKVKQVLQKVRTDGLAATIDSVRAKLDTPLPLGYCQVGRVVAADAESGYQPGQRVISSGPHAEVVAMPQNLTATIPADVSDDDAAFTVVGAIGLQGVRLLQPTLGERIVVSGLGLIGLMAVQILRANGCQVLGIDFDPAKLALARQFGAQTVDLRAGVDPVQAADAWTNGEGVDGVLITASTTSDALIHQAATMCRKRGRIVLVGVIGLNLQRTDFYEKELSFQVSCSYGPGRYESNYESKSLDYPIGFVRWTEQRNFTAILQLIADGAVQVEPLITHRFDFSDALDAYTAMSDPRAMGILLDYGPPQGADSAKLRATVERSEDGHWQTVSRLTSNRPPTSSAVKQESAAVAVSESTDEVQPEHSKDASEPLIAGVHRDVGIAFIGAGNFTTRTLLPLMPKHGVNRRAMVSGTGVSAAVAARKFGFVTASSDVCSVFDDPLVDAVFVTTPHHVHANMVCSALEAGKHVFVEKPLAITKAELDKVASSMADHPDRCVMVGFNRRFSPHMTALKDWCGAVPGPKGVIITVNAGALPANHWTQDVNVGGGRIIGEGCHFIDLARWLVSRRIRDASAAAITTGEGRLGDCVTIQMSFQDGSIATIHYLANGSKDFPKERIEVFSGGKVMTCANFRVSREVGGRRKMKTRKQDKGHGAGLNAFLTTIREGGSWPIPRSELLEISALTIDIANDVRDQIDAVSA